MTRVGTQYPGYLLPSPGVGTQSPGQCTQNPGKMSSRSRFQ